MGASTMITSLDFLYDRAKMIDVPKVVFEAFQQELGNVEQWRERWLTSFHEVHLALPVGRKLLNGGAEYVVLEATPDEYGEHDRCDLFARIGKEKWYVEVKKGWHGSGVGWNTKPKEQLQNCLHDLWKLSQLRGAANRRIFALLHFRQHDLSARAKTFDPNEVDAAADVIVRALKRKHEPPLPKRTFHSWIVMAIIESTLRKLGSVQTLKEPRMGKDFEREGKIMEHRVLVGCF